MPDTRPVRVLLGSETAPAPLLAYRSSWPPGLIPEAIVISVRGVVASDDGRGVEDECPEIVDAAAHSLAVRPSGRAPATAGHVVGDVRSAHNHGPGRDIHAAAEAVAAVAPAGTVATKGLVVVEGGSRKQCVSACDINAAAEAAAGVGTARAVAALGLVVRQLAAQDFEDTSAPDAAARTETGAGARGSGGTSAGLVVGERTAQDREPGKAGGRDEGTWAGVIDPPTEAVAAVAASSPGSADGLVVGQHAGRDAEGSPIVIEDTAAPCLAADASLSADGLVVGDRAVTDRGRGQALNISKAPAVSGARARNARVKGAGCVAGAAHRQVVADRQVAGGQGGRQTCQTGIGNPTTVTETGGS